MSYTQWQVPAKDRFTGTIKNSVEIDGTIKAIGSLPAISGKKVTRHHIIDIKTLQDVWNMACELEDDEVLEALCTWAWCPERQMSCFLQNKSIRPDSLIKAICWNPFNIVVGPASEIRGAENPGDHEFDHIAFVGIAALQTAELEFNTHVKRSRTIDRYMAQYCRQETSLPATPQNLAVFDQSAHSMRASGIARPTTMHQLMNTRANAINTAVAENLKQLLLSDRPDRYPELFKALRRQAKPDDPGINKEKDDKKPDKNSAYSPAYIPGALIDPRLWQVVPSAGPQQYISIARNAGSAAF